jgi:membrane dipeptidase
LVKDVGIDHVAIGTDMDANYQPVFDNYRQMPLIVGALLKNGMSETGVAKVIGGNFLQLFAATVV